MRGTLFPYDPSKPATIIFTILFAITLGAHIYQAIRGKALYMWAIIAATVMQVLGYASRYLAIQNDPSLSLFATSQVLIVVSPSFLAAQDYMIVGRMMAYVGPEASPISHTIITKLFVFLDIVCVLTQTGGISLFSTNTTNKNAITLGRNVLIIGLVAQIIAFMVFVILTIIFDIRSRRIKGADIARLRPLFIVFYISALMVIGRSIYRTIEFGEVDFDSGATGYLYNHEWPYYVLDAIPILIATVAFNIISPITYLPREKGLRMDGTVEEPRKHWWSSTKDKNQSQVVLMQTAQP
ncbi:RTA1-domain-containing protein [Serendipita vermifera]|nr:RTA1-domain-containing protein [Serendipita vermifera]